MTTTDVLWRLAEAYGMLLGMGLGPIVIVAVVMTILWRRDIRWTEAVLGLGGMALIGFSLWMIHDLDIANRKTLQPKIDEQLTELFQTVNRHYYVLIDAVCQPKAKGKATEKDVHALGSEAYKISRLVEGIKEELGSLLPSYYENERSDKP
jgi:hypothetical protein